MNEEEVLEEFEITDENIIQTGHFIYGVPEMVKQLTMEMGNHKAALQRDLIKIKESFFGTYGENIGLTYNYLTHKATIVRRHNHDQEDE